MSLKYVAPVPCETAGCDRDAMFRSAETGGKYVCGQCYSDLSDPSQLRYGWSAPVLREETGHCEHCPDGHRQPDSRPMIVEVGPIMDKDGQPIGLTVSYTNGHHVSEREAQWLRDLIAAPRQEETGTREPAEWKALALRLAESVPHDHSEATSGSTWTRDGVTHRRGNPEGRCPRCRLDREIASLAASLPSGDGEQDLRAFVEGIAAQKCRVTHSGHPGESCRDRMESARRCDRGWGTEGYTGRWRERVAAGTELCLQCRAAELLAAPASPSGDGGRTVAIEGAALIMREAVARHARTLDDRAFGSRADGDKRDRDSIDNELYNAVRALDPGWWDRRVPGLAETGEGRRMLDTVIGPIRISPECRVQACCGNGKRCWEAGRCLRDPAATPPTGETGGAELAAIANAAEAYIAGLWHVIRSGDHSQLAPLGVRWQKAMAAASATPPPGETGDADDDEITRRLHELAEGSWNDPRALLARVELYAEDGRMPSGGLRADIEMFLRAAPAGRMPDIGLVWRRAIVEELLDRGLLSRRVVRIDEHAAIGVADAVQARVGATRETGDGREFWLGWDELGEGHVLGEPFERYEEWTYLRVREIPFEGERA